MGWMLAGAAVGGVVFLGTTYLQASEDEVGPAVPRFVEETAGAGITHSYDGEFAYFVGGGVAVMDCDDDGFPDLFLAGGENPAGLYRNESRMGGPLRFARVEDPVSSLADVTGAYPLDVDSDGVTDLAVLRVGENVLLRGLGGCRFEEANRRWGFDGGADWTAAFSATWETGSSLPTLAIGNYLEVPQPGAVASTCASSFLYRPEAGTYASPEPLDPGLCTLSVLFADWDGSGRRDLRVANDRHYYTDGSEQLWRIEPGEEPRLYTAEEGWNELRIWGMGIALGDLTGDGRPEVFLTSQGDNKLQALDPDRGYPSYEETAIRRGLTAHRPFMGGDVLPSTAWHPQFEDVNNDGRLDLFVSKGNVEAQPDHASADPSNLLLGRLDGTFTEAAREAGIVSLGRSRGAAVVDLNLDGLLDVVEVERRENVRLWRNLGAGDSEPDAIGGWIQLRLRQDGSNRDAVGAVIEVRGGPVPVRREIVIGGGHAGGALGWVHVGLGSADRAEVRVRWPDGVMGPWMAVDAGSFTIVHRGHSSPQVWMPER